MDTRELHAWLRDELKELKDKVDGVGTTQAAMAVVQAEQAKDIAEHIRRTDLLETELRAVAADEVKPLKEFVTRLKGVGWFLGACATGAGAFAAITELLP